jgi:hypothetical protein
MRNQARGIVSPDLAYCNMLWNLSGRRDSAHNDEIFGDDNSNRLDVLFCK